MPDDTVPESWLALKLKRLALQATLGVRLVEYAGYEPRYVFDDGVYVFENNKE